MGEREIDGLGESLTSPGEEDQKEQDDVSEEAESEMASADSTPQTDHGSGSGRKATGASTADSGSSGLNESVNVEDSSPSQCQETTRNDTQCTHDAQPNSRFCQKHQPDKFGYKPADYERKQWHLRPEVAEALFDDSVTADSLYIATQKQIGVSFQKKSIENMMGEFLREHREEFIDYVEAEYRSAQNS
jgi:hypothetical protein